MVIAVSGLSGLSERVYLLRRQRGLSQKELSDRSGVKASTLSRIETGDVRTPTSGQIMKLARALDVSADYLLGVDDPPEEQDLPPELREQIARLAPEGRDLIAQLIAQANRLPDTAEGRAALVQAIRVAVGYLQSVGRSEQKS